jgi:hypothetical protein
MERAWVGCRTVLEGFQADLDSIRANARLSVEGKLQDAQAAARKRLAGLEGPRSVLKEGEGAIEQINTTLENQARTQGMNDAVLAQRQAFLLSWVAGLGKEQQVLAFHTAIRNSDKELLGALLSANRTYLSIAIPTLDDSKQRLMAEEALLKVVNPLQLKRRDDLKQAVQALGYSVQRVEDFIRSEAGLQAEAEKVREPSYV